MEEKILENIEINNNLSSKIKEKQEKFIESDIGKAINSAIDIGLKAALPDLIEDQIIDIKNTILENGFSEGIREVINSSVNIGKSAIGIITGEFENISQVQLAIKKGGILDSISNLLDYTINFIANKNIVDKNMSLLIKRSKNTIISSISDKIEQTLTNQLKAIEKLEKYCENWNIAYGIQDISKMEKEYKNIKNYLNKIIPLENIINKARTIENINTLLKNNGYNFNISEDELRLAQKLA